jgi:outer membrane protein OmpA-like peptidoglycan-associated protein
MRTWIILIVIAGLAITGCATKTGTGAAVGTGVGAAVGAGVGQAIGGSTGATLLGAGIGAVVGGLSGAAIGRYMDNQEQAMQQAIANSEAATMRREQGIAQGAHKENVQVLTVSFKSDYLFATNSATILPGAQPEVQRVSDVLRQYPETTIQVSGHTDNQGSEVYNQQLSERRAQAVRDAIVGMGVDPARITVIGYGESRPIASNDTAAGRTQNRRVEVRIVPRTA